MSELEPIAKEHNLALWLAYVAMFNEVIAAENGDTDSVERYKLADAGLASINCTFFMSHMRISVGWSALAMGLREDAAELAMMAEEIIDETGETYALSDLHRLHAAIARADDDTEAAERHLGTALEVARQQGAKLWELRAAIDLARLMQEQGRIDEANTLLDPIDNSIVEGDCPEDQATARKLLAELAA